MTTTNTIERIRWERKRVQKELKHLEQVIADDYNELTAPPHPPTTNLRPWLVLHLERGTSLTVR